MSVLNLNLVNLKAEKGGSECILQGKDIKGKTKVIKLRIREVKQNGKNCFYEISD